MQMRESEVTELSTERIVITGGAGFLGLHLQKQLLNLSVPEENLLIPLIEDYDLTKDHCPPVKHLCSRFVEKCHNR